MNGFGFWDGSNNEFRGVKDEVLNLLDFPMESLEFDGFEEYLEEKFQSYGPIDYKNLQTLLSQSNSSAQLYDAEKSDKVLEQHEYFDHKFADKERKKGNGYIKEQRYPEAIKHFTESLKRNPNDPKVYSKRAACYAKLGELQQGLKDAERCLELDPNFIEGYTRKGAVLFFMKKYDKALATYEDGLKLDPCNQKMLDFQRRCIEQINKPSGGRT